MTATAPIRHSQALRYGLLGLPLAFVALPLYVVLPNHYAREFGVPVAALGGLLLVARLFDALIDPALGRWIDRLFNRSPGLVLRLAALAALGLTAGFVLLFHPPLREERGLLAWAGAALALTYAAYSGLSVAHQSWGAMLGGDAAQRSRIVAWREGCALLGVALASVLPLWAGMDITAAVLAAFLAAGLGTWARSPHPVAAPVSGAHGLWLPLTRSSFRRLLGVFVLNGIASAIPATLVLFFVQDRLQAPRAIEPAFLATYFACAAVSMPGWLALVRRIGLAWSWMTGMTLSVAVFAFASVLSQGDVVPFLLVCAVSGAALGADLAVPGALLAGVIGEAGDRGRSEGAYFGWWNFASKLNLALAAGLALPLLEWAGYAPGSRDLAALQALTLAYCLLPCALKLAAAGLLYLTVIRNTTAP